MNSVYSDFSPSLSYLKCNLEFSVFQENVVFIKNINNTENVVLFKGNTETCLFIEIHETVDIITINSGKVLFSDNM